MLTWQCRRFWGRESTVFGRLTAPAGTWNSVKLPMDGTAEPTAQGLGVNTSGMHGSGALIIHGVRTLER